MLQKILDAVLHTLLILVAIGLGMLAVCGMAALYLWLFG